MDIHQACAMARANGHYITEGVYAAPKPYRLWDRRSSRSKFVGAYRSVATLVAALADRLD